jgi:hypothetical protein
LPKIQPESSSTPSTSELSNQTSICKGFRRNLDPVLALKILLDMLHMLLALFEKFHLLVPLHPDLPTIEFHMTEIEIDSTTQKEARQLPAGKCLLLSTKASFFRYV